MGIHLSFQRTQVPVSYTPAGYYTCVGKRRDEDYLDETTEFHKIQREYWGDLLRERQIEMEAKNKFNAFDDEETIDKSTKQLIKKFPNLTPDEIGNLRMQFQTFDINQDSLIDYEELMQVLDDLGETSDDEKRKEYFNMIDEDDSGSIDFEEFIGLVYSLHQERLSSENDKNDKKGIGLICNLSGYDDLQTIQKLTLSEKLLNGLFWTNFQMVHFYKVVHICWYQKLFEK